MKRQLCGQRVARCSWRLHSKLAFSRSRSSPEAEIKVGGEGPFERPSQTAGRDVGGRRRSASVAGHSSNTRPHFSKGSTRICILSSRRYPKFVEFSTQYARTRIAVGSRV